MEQNRMEQNMSSRMEKLQKHVHFSFGFVLTTSPSHPRNARRMWYGSCSLGAWPQSAWPSTAAETGQRARQALLGGAIVMRCVGLLAQKCKI